MSGPDTWTRYSAVVHVVRWMAEMQRPLGKTALQKLVYLAQELFACPLGYRYRLYNYGPYSRRLASDQDYLEFMHGVDIEYDPDQGYSILPGRRAADLEKRGGEFLANWGEKLDELLTEFGHFQAWQLEIYGTACFVDRDHAKMEETIPLETLAEEVARIKPQHDKNYIASALRDLHKRGYLRSTSDSLNT